MRHQRCQKYKFFTTWSQESVEEGCVISFIIGFMLTLSVYTTCIIDTFLSTLLFVVVELAASFDHIQCYMLKDLYTMFWSGSIFHHFFALCNVDPQQYPLQGFSMVFYIHFIHPSSIISPTPNACIRVPSASIDLSCMPLWTLNCQPSTP